MIIKLIDTKANGARATGYARDLSAYMADGDPRRLRLGSAAMDYSQTLSAYMTNERHHEADARERVLYKAAVIDGTPAGWEDGLADMERRLALRSNRVKKPLRHVVLSYRDDEHPTDEDCAQAITILASELRCEACTVLWAAHADTDNIHIHALFVMIDATTGGAEPFGQGADGRAQHKEAMQRAIARIEHAQSLQAEVGARYEVIGEHVVRKPTVPRTERRRAPLRQEILDFEVRSGFASFTRMAQELAAPIIEQARTWDELHPALARIGIGIRRSVNGGELFAGDDHVKLSNVDRQLSWPRLIKADRLGPFKAPPEDLIMAPFEPRVLDDDKASAWLSRQESVRAVNHAVDERIGSLMAQRKAAISHVKTEIAARRDDLSALEADPPATRDLAAAWPRLQARAIEALKTEFARRIEALRGLRSACAVEPDLDDIDLDALASPDCALVAPWHHAPGNVPQPVSIAGYDAVPCGTVVQYWRTQAQFHDRAPAFVDAGPIIWINDRSNDAVRATLMLANERFGGAAVFGDKDYLARCAKVATDLGIELEIITHEEALRRAKPSATGRMKARQAAARKVQEGRPPAELPDRHTDGPSAMQPQAAEENRDAGHGHVRLRRVAEPGPAEHPAVATWRLARRQRVPDHERQQLAAQALAEAGIDPAAIEAGDPLRQLVEDARAYARRAGAHAERGRGRG